MPDEPAAEPAHKLSYRDTMACVDDSGRIRCPTCGRFGRLADMRHTPALRGPGCRVTLVPHCTHCGGADAAT